MALENITSHIPSQEIREPMFESKSTLPLQGTGIGLRTSHYRYFLEQKIDINWLEVHSENYFGEGGFDLFVLEKLRQDYPISLHGVGLGLGSAHGISKKHLQKLKKLVDRIQPNLVSEHLSWGSISGRHLNDLLPLPLSTEALQLVCERVEILQKTLQRKVLLENVSTYLRFKDDEMSEATFLCAVSRQTGCGILLDVNNLYVNQCNHQEDAHQEIAIYTQMPKGTIAEIHLAGHLVTDECVVDHHGSRIDPKVWQLYEKVCKEISSEIPTLIEWDTDIPMIDVLIEEAKKAELIMSQTKNIIQSSVLI